MLDCTSCSSRSNPLASGWTERRCPTSGECSRFVGLRPYFPYKTPYSLQAARTVAVGGVLGDWRVLARAVRTRRRPGRGGDLLGGHVLRVVTCRQVPVSVLGQLRLDAAADVRRSRTPRMESTARWGV